MAATEPLVFSDLLSKADNAVFAAEGLLAIAKKRVSELVSVRGKPSAEKLEEHQLAAHGLAWAATYVEALRQMAGWARHLKDVGRFGELEQLILQVGMAEYLWQFASGIPMSQNEIIHPQDLGLDEADGATFWTEATRNLCGRGREPRVMRRLAELIAAQAGAVTYGDIGLDETMDMARDQFRKFALENVSEQAHQWHLRDELIPLDVISEMASLGVFGLTIPETYGGAGLGKTAMCVVSEELSRGYIGVGSLGTRSEIAAELILHNGTPEQKTHWLPKIASGEILPTAVFTEPNTGSDLASLRTRAVKDGNVWKIHGNKTWITHAARADVMTLLVRTNPDAAGYKGLSMFIAPKPRGTDKNPFPVKGMTGGEIKVLGYRGMKEFEIGFDGFEVKADEIGRAHV